MVFFLRKKKTNFRFGFFFQKKKPNLEEKKKPKNNKVFFFGFFRTCTDLIRRGGYEIKPTDCRNENQNDHQTGIAQSLAKLKFRNGPLRLV